MIEPTNWWKTKLVMLIAEYTPKCHDITRLISQSLDRPLPLRTRLAMRIHYLICVWCERYRDQVGFLHRAARACGDRGVQQTSGGLRLAAKGRIKLVVQQREQSP